ncbi:MAG TPA: DUF1330 domain-containing protein [Stellaceae bacterium]|nr:DUF1330 domain-containing protein [Stellaceae bacterium]
MPAYIVAEIEVTDPAEYDRYRPLAGASVAKFGGKFLARGGAAQLMEGCPEPERIVILEFENAAAARRWYDSPDYQEALKIRLAASQGRVYMVEG